MQGPKLNPDPNGDCDIGWEVGRFIRDLNMSRDSREFFPTGRSRPREMLVYVVHAGLKLDSGVTNPAGVTGVR